MPLPKVTGINLQFYSHEPQQTDKDLEVCIKITSGIDPNS